MLRKSDRSGDIDTAARSAVYYSWQSRIHHGSVYPYNSDNGIVFRQKCRRNVWIAVVIGLAGMCLLCLYRGLDSVTFGDVMMLCASFLCAVHIHTIDHFVKDINPVMLTCLQFITAGFCALYLP